jgi:hypothetical protein
MASPLIRLMYGQSTVLFREATIPPFKNVAASPIMSSTWFTC